MAKAVACYVRVSTVGQNVAGQRREITAWLKGHGIKKPLWFVDKTTGDNLDRPEFERLQEEIFHGRVGTVVVWKLDRLSRSLRDGVNVLSDWCERGLRVVSVTQQIDFNGAVGKMLAAVLLGVAEMEQENRRERQAAGIAAARERGVYKGRKPGSTKNVPARARQLRAKGLKVREIADALKVSERTAKRYLKATVVTQRK